MSHSFPTKFSDPRRTLSNQPVVHHTPHVGLDVQQLQSRDPRLARHVLQDFEPGPAVFIKLGADVQQGLPRPAELLPGEALVQLLPRHALALLQQVEIPDDNKKLQDCNLVIYSNTDEAARVKFLTWC